MPKLDEYVRINEAAKYLGVCRNTLRNWGRGGRIAEYRHPVNNYRLYKISDLDKLLQTVEQPRAPRTGKRRRPTRAK